jgi:hypothetical protein
MALFPTSPTNGQTANVDGIQYTYSSSQTAWVRSGTFVGNAIANTVTASGNITANFFIGNGSQLTGITAATANTVTDNAQPNITSVGTLTGLSVNGSITAANITANTGVFTGNGAGLSQLAGANVTGTVANATFATSAGSATTAGTVTTAAQPNITSVGNLTALTVTGNTFLATTSGNVGVGVSSASTKMDVDGGEVRIGEQTAGNGAWLNVNLRDGTTASAAIRVSERSSASSSESIPVTQPHLLLNRGSESLGSFIKFTNARDGYSGIGSLATVADGHDIRLYTGTGTEKLRVDANGNVGIGNTSPTHALSVTGTTNISGNLSAGNISTSGVLSVTGNASAGNISATAGTFTSVSGNGSALTALNASNISTGTLAQARLANSNVILGNTTLALGTTTTTIAGLSSVTSTTFVGALTGAATTAGTVTTAAQPNITSVGTLTDLSVSGNAVIGGNLTVNGNLVYVNVDTLAVSDPIIELQTGANGAAPTANSGKDVGTALNYFDTAARVAFMGWDVSNAEFGLASVASISGEVVTFTTYGNLRVGNVIGNGQALTGLNGSNITTGTVAAERVATLNQNTTGSAATVTTAAQPNITSVGTLTGLGVNGTITGVNITANTGVFTGNGSGLSAIAGANVTGTVANATFATSAGSATTATSATTAGTVTTAAQPNITSVGTLTSLGVSGTITAANITANTGVFTGNGSALTALNGSNITTGTVAAARVATLNQNTTGSAATVTTAAQPNITSVGTLTSLGVSGTITAGTLASDGALSLSASGIQAITANTNGAERFRINSSGNVGIGTPFPAHTLSVTGTASISTSLQVANITTGANSTAGTVTGNWTLTAGSRWQSTYADLAERYIADEAYEPGTVVVLGGENEVTIENVADSHKVAGVVTTNPAYIMNAELQGDDVVEVALIGRVPCKVVGPISKGDLLTSAEIAGYAHANNIAGAGRIIGKSLENFDGEIGVIEIMVGKT